MTTPYLTIAIPAYNAATHFKRTLPLLPVDPDIEILVIANGCTDQTVAVVAEYLPHARIIELAIGSVAVARDVALQEARGQYLAFRDADDEVVPGGLERLAARLDAEPSLDLIGGAFIWVEKGQEIRTICYPPSHDQLFVNTLLQCPLHLASSMLRKERFRNMPACPLYPMAQDWAFLWQAFKHGCQIQTISQPVLRYVRHSESTTATIYPGNQLNDFVTILRGQFLEQCGIRLNAAEMMVFINTTPCIHWRLEDVLYLRTLARPYALASQVYNKIQQQNRLLPQRALKDASEQILADVKALYGED